MVKRSIGVTVLAFCTVMVAIFAQYAAIALLLTGRAADAAGPFEAGLTLVTGATFLVLAVLAYGAGFGLWFRKGWARRTAIVVYITMFVANASLALLSTNLVTAVVVSLAVVSALVYLRRPAVVAEIEGVADHAPETDYVVDRPAIVKPAH